VEQALDGVEEAIDDSFLERDDGVLRDGDGFGTHLAAAGSDVAVADTVPVAKIAHAIFSVERVHLKSRRVYQETRADELIVLVMFAQDVAYILA
jgi:hypothetical protein